LVSKMNLKEYLENLKYTLPSSMLCPHCGSRINFSPYKWELSYIHCPVCNSKFSMRGQTVICQNCGKVIRYSLCPLCGLKIIHICVVEQKRKIIIAELPNGEVYDLSDEDDLNLWLKKGYPKLLGFLCLSCPFYKKM